MLGVVYMGKIMGKIHVRKALRVIGCFIGVLLFTWMIVVPVWTEWRERGMMRAVAAWEESVYPSRDETIGAETPEEAYAQIHDAVIEEDEDTVRTLMIGNMENAINPLRALPEPERVTFLPDVVSGIARALVIEDAPSTTLTIGGRPRRIAAGPLERVLLFQQLINGRWALALP